MNRKLIMKLKELRNDMKLRESGGKIMKEKYNKLFIKTSYDLVYGFYGGGYTGSYSNVIDYIDMSLTSGNAFDKGDLTVARYGPGGVLN